MILDTCALLWLAQGSDRLSANARDRIEAAPMLCISAITGFEVGIKYHRGKLKLPALPGEWLQAIIEHHGISVLPLDLPTCVRATELPAVHADPCDRFIIAAAEVHDLTVVSGDAVFGEYGVDVIC